MEIEFLPDATGCGIGHSKCMIVGGYVVLDPKNYALVVDLEPKIKCNSKIINNNASQMTVNVITCGRKYNSSEYLFKYQYKFVESDWTSGNLANRFEKFILASLNSFFTYYSSINTPEIELFIEADPEFYTQDGKTGLGSSSATIVSIIMSLMQLADIAENKDLLFQLSSIANTIAQMKVGSGFDLSCAIWGPQIFRRPPAEIISSHNIGKDWGNVHDRFAVPGGMYLYLIKGGSGSSTTDLVRIFNSHKNDPKHISLYEKLIEANKQACNALQNGSIAEIQEKFLNLRNIQIRITDEWNVPILPQEIRVLISKLEKIPKYITSIPPGAGGYDALAVITDGETEFPSEFVIIAKRKF